MRRALRAALLGLALTTGEARAQDELGRIPEAANATPAAPATGNGVFYLQNDVIGTARRDDLVVPSPPPPPARWEERLFADAREDWSLGEDVRFVYSGRLNLRAEDGIAVPNHEDIRHDLREAYFAWQVDGETFLELGRINLKSGVALGFNPTDFFKTRAVVEPLSVDPSVLREDRLGTLMLYGQHLWERAALTLAAAPKVTQPSPLYFYNDLPSFNPMFDRTNAADRFLVKGSAALFEDFAPEVLAYSESGHWSFGSNLTEGFGQQVVGYLEWAGGDRTDLIDSALTFGEDTGTIPHGSPSPLPSDPSRTFQNDVAAGLSYTTPSKITFNLEYHVHQAGFSGADWKSWFGGAALHNAAVDAELWYIRGYAAEQQEPVARHEVFLRADWVDAFVEDLEITGFVNTDLRDASGFSQIEADYYLSREWTIGALAAASFGGKRSDYGSLPSAGSFIFRVSRYF